MSTQRPWFRSGLSALAGGTLAFSRPGVAEVLLGGCIAVILLGVVLPGVWAKPHRRRAALAVLAELRGWIAGQPGDAAESAVELTETKHTPDA